MTHVCFENPGVLDMDLVKNFGVSVKDEDSIGYFGTGLKYALAILMATGQEVWIQAGLDGYKVGTQKREIRGKEFFFVTLGTMPLNFTTELGKNWPLWGAFRELYSNALDEGGKVFTRKKITEKEGFTRIYVSGDRFQEIYEDRASIFIKGRPAVSSAQSVAYRKSGRYLYYKGIRAYALDQPSAMTYNITKDIDLTEDRTISNVYEAKGRIACDILRSHSKEFIDQALSAGDGSFEWTLSYEWHGRPSAAFLEVAARKYEENPLSLSSSVREVLKQYKPEHRFTDARLTETEERKLAKAKDFAKRLGFDPTPYKMTIVDSLGDDVLAMALNKTNEIVLTKTLFNRGMREITLGVIEEVAHLQEGHGDCTRAMQTFLFNKILSLGEEVLGEDL